MQLLREYFERNGDIVAAYEEADRWTRHYPEFELGLRAKQLIAEGREKEALPLCRRAIELNPLYWAGYTNLGSCFIGAGQWDSAQAVLEIANGINPNNATIVHNLAYTLMRQGKFTGAGRLFQRAIELDSSMINAYIHLARVYMTLDNSEPLDRLLEAAAGREDIPTAWQGEAADYYIRKGNVERAANLYGRALAGGLDSSAVTERVREYPELREYLDWPVTE
jgi:tetratricopeptide (TPR) repeat protein